MDNKEAKVIPTLLADMQESWRILGKSIYALAELLEKAAEDNGEEVMQFGTTGDLLEQGFKVSTASIRSGSGMPVAVTVEAVAPGGSRWRAEGDSYTDAGQKLVKTMNKYAIKNNITRPEDF